MDKRTIIFVLCIAATFFGMNYYFGTNREVQPKPTTATAPKAQEKKESAETPSIEEKFYVLENSYQQLVFSNIGAALAEINLPFKNESHDKSVVRPIDFDRTMEKDYPFNDHFPAHSYYTASTGTSTLKEETQVGGYYPLIRRSLVLSKSGRSIEVPPRNYALNIVSDFKEVGELSYEVKEFDANHITFEATQPHRRITKTYAFAKNANDPNQAVPYVIDVTIQVEGDSKGLWLTSGVPDVELVSGNYTPTLKYEITRQNKPDVSVMDLPKEREVISVGSIYPNWVSNANGYFGVIVNPLQEIGAGYKVQFAGPQSAPTRLGVIDATYDRYKLADYPGYNVLLPLSTDNSLTKFLFFAGPIDDEVLKNVDSLLIDTETGHGPNFIAAQNFQGWFSFISEPFAKLLFILMNFFYKLTSSWAFSIVLLTVALRVMLYPLNAWSFKSMKRMQMLAPEVSAIQEKYKKDQKKAQIEIMNLYRERKVNPFTGCLPLLIQMPFLIGMFDLLKSTFPLRGAPFIPGWIDNLTAPDVLFSWSYPIPFIGTAFHLLPFILGAVMFFQQRMSATAPKDVNLMTDQQRQQRFMGNIMVVVFTVMFYNFPSGLNIYWLSSMLLGMLQQWYTNKKLEVVKR